MGGPHPPFDRRHKPLASNGAHSHFLRQVGLATSEQDAQARALTNRSRSDTHANLQIDRNGPLQRLLPLRVHQFPRQSPFQVDGRAALGVHKTPCGALVGRREPRDGQRLQYGRCSVVRHKPLRRHRPGRFGLLRRRHHRRPRGVAPVQARCSGPEDPRVRDAVGPLPGVAAGVQYQRSSQRDFGRALQARDRGRRRQQQTASLPKRHHRKCKGPLSLRRPGKAEARGGQGRRCPPNGLRAHSLG